MTTYILKTNLPKKKYNCISCNKEMAVPLLECITCSSKFAADARKRAESEKDPSVDSYNPPRKRKPLSDSIQEKIKSYFHFLKTQDIIFSRRESLSYINKKFELDLTYSYLSDILRG